MEMREGLIDSDQSLRKPTLALYACGGDTPGIANLLRFELDRSNSMDNGT